MSFEEDEVAQPQLLQEQRGQSFGFLTASRVRVTENGQPRKADKHCHSSKPEQNLLSERIGPVPHHMRTCSPFWDFPWSAPVVCESIESNPCYSHGMRSLRIGATDRLPTKTYDKTDELTIDGVHIRLYHWAPGHTSGDTIVYLPDEKVVFGGDLLVTNRPDTTIHMEKNGSAAGWIKNAKGMLGLDADMYLTGHGEVMTKADVQKKLDFIQDKYDKIKAMVAQGKSLDEVKTSFGEPTAAPPPNPNGAPPAATLTEVIYKEASKKS